MLFLFKTEAFLLEKVRHRKFQGVSNLLLFILGIVLQDHTDSVVFLVGEGPFPGGEHMK